MVCAGADGAVRGHVEGGSGEEHGPAEQPAGPLHGQWAALSYVQLLILSCLADTPSAVLGTRVARIFNETAAERLWDYRALCLNGHFDGNGIVHEKNRSMQQYFRIK